MASKFWETEREEGKKESEWLRQHWWMCTGRLLFREDVLLLYLANAIDAFVKYGVGLISWSFAGTIDVWGESRGQSSTCMRLVSRSSPQSLKIWGRHHLLRNCLLTPACEVIRCHWFKLDKNFFFFGSWSMTLFLSNREKKFQTTMGPVRITSWYQKLNGSHFDVPPSSIHKMTELGGTFA